MQDGLYASWTAKELPKLKRQIEIAVRKELNGERADGTPSLDLGTGGGSRGSSEWRSIDEARKAVARMSPTEYQRRETEIDATFARLLSRR